MNGQEPLTCLKGVGDKTASLFKKLDIFTIDDLMHTYPRAYDTFEPPKPIAGINHSAVTAVEGILLKDANLRKLSHMQVITAEIKDESGTLSLIWFNMPFLKNTLKAGLRFIFRGLVIRKAGRFTMQQPEIFTLHSYDQVVSSMQPIYCQTKGLSNKTIVRLVSQCLESRTMEKDYMPEDIRKTYQLAEYNFAIRHIHFPKDQKDLFFARERMVFDEFFLFLLTVRQLKDKKQEQKNHFPMVSQPVLEQIAESLPYRLTKAQNQVLSEIIEDLSGNMVMNRLVQGDVGSGKTIIAILALLYVTYNGYQGALMAPTEVLAKQHYESMIELFEANHITKVPLLLTGSMTAKEKRIAYEKIQDNEADIIIGTHALIQEKVVFDHLALVITDEQHRFGVKQRETLGNKGNFPHILVMSATPIPRTLAIIIYGDLDLSVIDELPANRLPIKNCVVKDSERKKVYRFLQREILAGRQAYVICPMVEESEMIEAENVIDYTKRLRQELLDSVRVEYLHGKMKPKEKNERMGAFLSGEIQILVSTTVIEVGVNVPNATVIVIENAERFGLAQLHQLRGRVGRGKYQSYCIFISASDTKDTQKRLEILTKSNDGFYIASEDLKLRGPGDILGLRQSGLLEFKLGDIFTDAKILKSASEAAAILLEKDENLSAVEHLELKKRLEDYQRLGMNHMSL